MVVLMSTTQCYLRRTETFVCKFTEKLPRIVITLCFRNICQLSVLILQLVKFFIKLFVSCCVFLQFA